MHDEGLIDLSNGGRWPTPIQKHLYAMAKDYWTDEEREQTEQRIQQNDTRNALSKGI